MFNNSGAGGGASPGLLRRRYSMPETIMRKYRLAQQRSEAESEEGGRWSATGSGGRGACAWCGSRASVARREREHMRKSALLRLWGRAGASTARACPCAVCGPGASAAPVGTRSLDASHSELHTSPRHLRLDSSRERRADCPSPASMCCVDAGQTRKLTPRGGDRTIRTPLDSPLLRVDDCSLSDLSEPFTASPPTMKEIDLVSSEPYAQLSTGGYIDGRVSERSISVDNDESNVPHVIPYMQPLTLETPSYDVLEIVVSETLEVRQAPAVKNELSNRSPQRILKNEIVTQNKAINIPIDEYVSNILVESLNSLNDQLEYMNASIGSDRKLSIVEKEIKVKLQNTGVNTIVHLSPTSNNQIIFGNEELYESDVREGHCNITRDTCSSNIREETISLEMNNNLTSAESLREHNNDSYHKQNKTEEFLNIPSDTVNKAVLQQIQKLFKDELQSLDPEMNSPEGPLPGISHIEISNVDVFIDNNGGTLQNANTIEMQTNRNFEVLGGVGSCNYYQEVESTAVVPRISAFPHTESMEVNTSSSEDAEILGSECTSLVDSLDDPNSPRSILLRKSFNNRRSELVRSAIDVLDLLPENMNQSNDMSPKEKSESFFIRIKDDDCDCEKENIVVADHMPETIKQRLFRRHRKRELRMECARRSKVKQLKRDLDSNHTESLKLKKDVERESVILINSLIDDVIYKIAHDEYKCMYIKEKANRISMAKSDINLFKNQWKKDSENNNNRDKKNNKSNVSHSYSKDLEKNHQNNEKVIAGRASVQVNTPSSPEDSPPMRIYQKSEIHDGNKCIEILEILEYVNSSQNSDTTNSDENHNLGVKNRKSRIPVPVNEKLQKAPKIKTQKSSKSNASRKTHNLLSDEKNCKSSQLLANMLLSALGAASDASDADDGSPPAPAARRSSVPCETRSRSNSLRFKNVFDIIPEEKSSLSIESTGDDTAYSRRASAPSLYEDLNSTDQEERRVRPVESQKYRALSKELRCGDTRSTGTSPMPESYRQATQINVSAMTSPLRKSAGTSPIRVATATSSSAGCQQPMATPRPAQPHAPAVPRALRSRHEEGSNGRRKSISTQHEPTRRLRGGHSESDTSPSVLRLKRGKRISRQEKNGSNSIDSVRRSSEDVPSMGLQERKKERTKIKEMLGVERRRRSEAKLEAETERERRRRREADEKREGNVDEEWSSSESSGSLLCSLAPAWLTARRRRRRATPSVSGEWAVTVAGSCPSALPNDVEMRLRFPERRLGPSAPPAAAAPPALPEYHAHPSQATMPQSCHRAVECGGVCARAHGRGAEDAGRLTVTVKKEASDSSIVASKSIKKSSDLLPDLHTYRASRSNTRSSLKTRRGYSLHCWLPQEEPTPIRARNGLTVEGNAIVPRRKPRAPSMSERDLTRQASRSFLPTNLRNIF